MALTALGTAAEVLLATGHDPFARGSLRRQLVRGWLGAGAVAWMGTDPDERVLYLSVLGQPMAAAALITDLLPELAPRQRVTLPRGTAALLPAWVGLGSTTDWDFRWLGEPPAAQPGEQQVVAAVSDAEVEALLTLASPRPSVRPGDTAVRRWWGVPGDPGDPGGPGEASGGPGEGSGGEPVGDAADLAGPVLRACAADTSAATGVGHLSSIAVAPDARGRGLGKAVTAALTRSLLAGDCDIVTLGMYADNAAGRGVYDALGFRDEHHFSSGPLVQRGRW